MISYSSPELEAKVFGMSKDVKKMPVFELQGGVGGGVEVYEIEKFFLILSR